MDSLVGYGSDEDNDTERYGSGGHSVEPAGRRREDDTNYDDVNMDMSEDSESEPELPPAEPVSRHSSQDHRGSDDSRERDRDREPDRRRSRERSHGRDRRRESPRRADRDRREPRRDDRHDRSSRGDRGSGSRRGLLGDRPEERHAENKVPALMDLKPFGGDAPPGLDRRPSDARDARDATSPRFVESRDRRDRDRERERDRDNRHSRRSEEKRPYSERHERRRSRSRGPPPSTSGGERRSPPPAGDYRPSSYKVNKKLEVMEKMGLQIKTPDGGMATAQQLRAAAGDMPALMPAAARALDQVQKRKLLWSHKGKSEAEEAAKWSGARFAQDSDGKQASKFMRLMGIKSAAATVEPTVDPVKKQEELFQAMQAQYDVARATTHTMRGQGLGFQRGQF